MAKNLYTNVSLFATPSDALHLVNKKYVDLAISKKVKDPVRVVTAEPIVGTYDADTMTLTQTTGSAFVFEGVTVAVGDRILVVGQTDATQNGIYVVTTLGVAESTEGAGDSVPGVLTRAEDFDASEKIVPNCLIPVMEGSSNGDITWQLINDSVVILDTTSLRFGAYKDPAATSVFTAEFEVEADDVEWDITHGLNSTNVLVQVYNEDGEECLFAIKKESNNLIKIKADATPEVGSKFTVVIIG